MSADQDERALLEMRANQTRDRLLQTIDALDRRRHDITDVKLQVRKHAVPIAVTAGGALLALLGAVGIAVYHAATADQRRRRERYEAVKRFWRHPERIGRKSNRSPIVAEVGRKLLVGALTFVGLQLAKRTLTSIATLPSPERPQVIVKSLPA